MRDGTDLRRQAREGPVLVGQVESDTVSDCRAQTENPRAMRRSTQGSGVNFRRATRQFPTRIDHFHERAVVRPVIRCKVPSRWIR